MIGKSNLYNRLHTWHNNQVQKAASGETDEAQMKSREKYQSDIAHIQGLVDELTLADGTSADQNSAPGHVYVESPLRPDSSRDAEKSLYRVGDTIKIQTVENVGGSGIDSRIKLDTLTYSINPDGTIGVQETNFREGGRPESHHRSYFLDTKQEQAFSDEGRYIS